MQGVILAAGKGSRLHPITLARSKAMMPILGRPMVARVVEMLHANAIDEFILVVSPDDPHIEDYFIREYLPTRADVRVHFVYQTERRGMADALGRAAPLIRGPFVLSACDNLVAAAHVDELLKVLRAHPHAQGVLSLMPIPPDKIGKTGMVTLDGERVTRIVEKPDPRDAFSDMGSLPLYVFQSRLLDYLPEVPLSQRGEYELQDAIQMLIDREGGVYGVVTDSRLTVTSAADLLAVNRHYLLTGDGAPQLAPRRVGPGTHLITPLYIEEGVEIGAGCVIGPHVYVERGAVIGDGARLEDAVVLRDATVEAGRCVVGDVVA